MGAPTYSPIYLEPPIGARFWAKLPFTQRFPSSTSISDDTPQSDTRLLKVVHLTIKPFPNLIRITHYGHEAALQGISLYTSFPPPKNQRLMQVTSGCGLTPGKHAAAPMARGFPPARPPKKIGQIRITAYLPGEFKRMRLIYINGNGDFFQNSLSCKLFLIKFYRLLIRNE